MLEKLYSYQFRNLSPLEIEFSPHINIFTGANGQGKTNLLEAIYLLSRGSSFRTNREEDLIQWDCEGYYLKGDITFNAGEKRIEIKSSPGNKRALVDGVSLDKLSELTGMLSLVIFVPDDLQLVKAGPSRRRRFLNNEIEQVSSYYGYQLIRYKKIIRERNNLLKMGKRCIDQDLLKVMDRQLVLYGAKILKKRNEIVNKLTPLARLMNRRLTDGKEDLSLSYESSLQLDNNKEDEEEIRNIFIASLKEKREEEFRRGYTLLGPHRDDLKISVNGKCLKTFGSQGQQRTGAIALKLAEIELIKSEIAEYPLLLLDDVFSELDSSRSRLIRNLIKDKIQSFITSTDFHTLKDMGYHSNYFRVKSGRINNIRKE